MHDFDFNAEFDRHDEPLEEQHIGRVPRMEQYRMTVRTSVGGIFSYARPSPQSLVPALWRWVPVIWRMVVLETEITEAKEGSWRPGDQCCWKREKRS